jgi:hypothetical protein
MCGEENELTTEQTWNKIDYLVEEWLYWKKNGIFPIDNGMIFDYTIKKFIKDNRGIFEKTVEEIKFSSTGFSGTGGEGIVYKRTYFNIGGEQI